MPDEKEAVAPSAEMKQSRTADKAGARDSKKLRNNANRDLEAPGMPDAEKEKEIAERFSGRGHGSKSPGAVRAVLRLAARGYSPSQMHSVSSQVPHFTTIYKWLRNDPELNEEFKSRQRDYIDDEIRQAPGVASAWKKDGLRLRKMIAAARRIPKKQDLKPFEQVQAEDRMIQRVTDLTMAAVGAEDHYVHRTMQLAERQLPDWRRDSEGDSGVFIEVNLGSGPVKTIGLPGSTDGQNVKALAAGRWKALPAPADVGTAGSLPDGGAK